MKESIVTALFTVAITAAAVIALPLAVMFLVIGVLMLAHSVIMGSLLLALSVACIYVTCKGFSEFLKDNIDLEVESCLERFI